MSFDVRNLDWTMQSKRVSSKSHWRIFVCTLVAVIVSTFAWFVRTPHAFWFMILWVGLATGSFVGLLSGSAWQLYNRKRWPQTSGCFIVASFFAAGIMAAVAVALLAPALNNEELLRQQFRSLTASDISAIDIDIKWGHLHETEGARLISMFISAARAATLFYPSHEGSIAEFSFTMHFKNGTSVSCEGDVPERHADDVTLKCPGALAGRVLIPSGRKWLDETQA